MNRRVVLRERPIGVPQADRFQLDEAPAPQPADGQILVRNHYLSVDPAMRGWLSDKASYADPIAVGDVMRAFAVGEVVSSRHPDFAPGDRLMGLFGWQEQAAVGPEAVMLRITDHDLPLSLFLGVLGLNGLTAYFGLIDVCAPNAGETVLVSTAAGAVGSCVGQIAKSLGCRTVGIAGRPEKVRQCLDEFGYDAAVDYKSEPDLDAAIAQACPAGVDVYFDNTAGPISDAVLRHINIGARIAVCGTAAISTWDPWPVGARPERHLLVKRAMMRGFLAFDYADRFGEAAARLADWVRQGRLRYREHILEGLDQAPGSIARLYAGDNHGKLLIRLPAAKG